MLTSCVQMAVIELYPRRINSVRFTKIWGSLKVGYSCRFAWVVICKDFFEISNRTFEFRNNVYLLFSLTVVRVLPKGYTA
jgi:hypothetical protein